MSKAREVSQRANSPFVAGNTYGFQKGKSGNPKGAKSSKGKPLLPTTIEYKRFVQLCRENADKALRTLLDVMSHGEDAQRVRAAGMLLDRAFGKATEHVVVEQQTVAELPPAQRLRLLESAVDAVRKEIQ
jgi:hypothetical protein